MAATTTFHEMNRKQSFDAMVQEVLLESSKPYNVLEQYFAELLEYLHPEMDDMLLAKGSGIQFWWGLQVKYSKLEPWIMMTRRIGLVADTTRTTTTGKFLIPNRDQLAEKMEDPRHIILQSYRSRIRGK